LQAALGVDGAFVATTDTRPSTRRLSKALNITLLDGDAVAKLTHSDTIKTAGQLAAEEFNIAVKRIDEGRRSSEWRQWLSDARASLISGLGVQSANKNLGTARFFASQLLDTYPGSEQAQVALRLVYLGRVDEFWRNDVFGIPELNQA
jgi:hypothetical protein